MRQIETEVRINAAPARVFAVLMDFAAYPAWNPFITQIAGQADIGGKLAITIAPPGGKAMSFKPTVLAITPGQEFRWRGRVLVQGLFDGEHYFKLQGDENGGTRLVHGEQFSGLLVGLMGSMLDKTADGFRLMNEALKKKAEEPA